MTRFKSVIPNRRAGTGFPCGVKTPQEQQERRRQKHQGKERYVKRHGHVFGQQEGKIRIRNHPGRGQGGKSRQIKSFQRAFACEAFPEY
jgi:hypothetical protein